MPTGSHLPHPPQKNAVARPFIYSDHVQTMLVQSRSIASRTSCLSYDYRSDEQPHCEESFDADLRHRERSECEATGPLRSGVGWDDVPHIPFCKNFDGKWESHQYMIQREGLGSGQISKRYPNFWKVIGVSLLTA